jgi:hypothetical protein
MGAGSFIDFTLQPVLKSKTISMGVGGKPAAWSWEDSFVYFWAPACTSVLGGLLWGWVTAVGTWLG